MHGVRGVADQAMAFISPKSGRAKIFKRVGDLDSWRWPLFWARLPAVLSSQREQEIGRLVEGEEAGMWNPYNTVEDDKEGSAGS